MSLTDEIYCELSDGLERGLDWQQFLAKHSSSKGPLYNAIGRFFTEVGPKIVALNEEKRLVQSELEQAGLKMDSLDRKIKEAESNIAYLEDRENVLNGQVETLEAKLLEKSELVKHLAELEKLGFDSERLRQLQEALKEIGMRHGLGSKQTVDKFFDDLKDYESVLGAELQLKGLQTQIETKKLESENWQAKEEALKRKHDDLKQAIEAVRALRGRGIEIRRIITWHQILSRFQTLEEFDQSLAQYGDMTNLLKAKKEETENWELQLAKDQSRVETLKKERAKIEGAIDVLKVAGVKELKTITEEATKQLKVMVASGIRENQSVGQEVRSEFSNFIAQLDASIEKVFEMGQKFERIRQELQKYEGIKDVLESHTTSSEEEK